METPLNCSTERPHLPSKMVKRFTALRGQLNPLLRKTAFSKKISNSEIARCKIYTMAALNKRFLFTSNAVLDFQN